MRFKFKWVFTLLITLLVQLSFGQEKIITGIIIEAGLPLPGVNVQNKGTNQSVQTDFDGKYTIKAREGDVLEFSFLGMKTVRATVGTSGMVNMTMEQDAQELEAVVVTALGIEKSEKSVGFATQTVTGDVLNKGANNNLAGALQGKVAGMQITPSSGAPGASSQILIRGVRSISGNNTPLYVIDGMPVASEADFSTGNSVTGADRANRAIDIDPNEIESITVLKGQAAAALYGMRASNGVIMITTKSGKGLVRGAKPIVTYATNTSFETISKKPSLQNEYAQGSQKNFDPYSSLSWGPKISELPNNATYGGNVPNALNGGVLRPGKYYVPQRELAGLDPWVTPGTYDNMGDYFNIGYTINHSLNVSQALEKTNYSFGIGSANQQGILPGTSMDRMTVKGVVETKLNDTWKTGFSTNYVETKINKSASGSDSPLPGVFSAPRSYDLKGIPSSLPEDPYTEIYYRKATFNNPYWAAEHNEFSEKTNRFFGNAHIQYDPIISTDGDKKLTIRYQAGVDSYTTNYRNIYEYGNVHNAGSSSKVDLSGITKDVINSLFTVRYTMDITEDFGLYALVGNEYNHENRKIYEITGLGLNFGGWPHIANANSVSANEIRRQERRVGFFTDLGVSYKKMLFLNGTLRSDIVSTMPRDNRTFTYPSLSSSFVLTELEGLKDNLILSFAKLRASVAEVGTPGVYFEDYLVVPSYGGGFWGNTPFQYPLGGVNALTPGVLLFDPNLKPVNTTMNELGIELKFLNDRVGIDYTYSVQNSKNQILDAPLAGSSGARFFRTNGGDIRTKAHEVIFFANPVRMTDFDWNFTINFSKVDSYVLSLREGVETLSLGGFTEPQVRAGVGDRFPIIFGTSFARDEKGNIIVDANGLPMQEIEKALGEVAPKFTLGGTTQFAYKNWTLGATFDWKHGGKMYSMTNSLLMYYGSDARTADRESEYIFPGVKEDGSTNDVPVGGSGNPNGHQLLQDRLSNISESAVFDASFVKLREVAVGYTFPKFIEDKVTVRMSAFARNLLLWSKMPNLDPEASQGNNNMAGGFEAFSIPQVKSLGFALNVTF